MSQKTRIGCGGRADGTRRNIRIGNRRTSVKLEPEMWDALAEICDWTKKDLNQICTEVHHAGSVNIPNDPGGSGNFTSELRVFIVTYYRAALRRSGFEGIQTAKVV